MKLRLSETDWIGVEAAGRGAGDSQRGSSQGGGR